MPASSRRWTAGEVRAMQDESRAWPRYELIEWRAAGDAIAAGGLDWHRPGAAMPFRLDLPPFFARVHGER